MKGDQDLKFEVGDRVKFVLRFGKIEEGVRVEAPDEYNVVSLEQQTSVCNKLKWNESQHHYRVVECCQPRPTAAEAAMLAIDHAYLLRVVREK